eukprot:5286-Hanusia_phi.AAC.1
MMHDSVCTRKFPAVGTGDSEQNRQESHAARSDIVCVWMRGKAICERMSKNVQEMIGDERRG